MSDSVARILRTIAQLIAGGLLTAFINQVITDVPAAYAPYVVLVSTLAVTICQNLVEEWKGQGILRPSSPPAPKNVEPVANV